MGKLHVTLSTDRTDCPHERILRSDGEDVCTKCGAVLDSQSIDDAGTGDQSPSAPNLFLDKALGSREGMPKMDGTAAARRYFSGRTSGEKTLSRFSNVCEKLGLPRHVRDDAWGRFSRTSRQVPRRKAEQACIAILHACIDGETAVTDEEIVDAVKKYFNRKKIPSMAKIVHLLMDVLGHNGAKDYSKYVFNTMLKKLTGDLGMSEAELARHKKFAWSLFTEIYDEENPKRRARSAIENAFGLGRWGPR